VDKMASCGRLVIASWRMKETKTSSMSLRATNGMIPTRAGYLPSARCHLTPQASEVTGRGAGAGGSNQRTLRLANRAQHRADYDLAIDHVDLAILVQVAGGGRHAQRLLDHPLDIQYIGASVQIRVARA
jgi:hypothetical protein